MRNKGLNYSGFTFLSKVRYWKIITKFCGNEAYEIVKKKDLSSGMLALFLAMESNLYDKYIMAGFRFNQEYEYQESLNKPNGHFQTDMGIMKLLLERKHPIYTTESSFNELAGITLVE
jgi:hypothetical protein